MHDDGRQPIATVTLKVTLAFPEIAFLYGQMNGIFQKLPKKAKVAERDMYMQLSNLVNGFCIIKIEL